MWDIAVGGTNYSCMATATIAASVSRKCFTCIELSVYLPSRGMIEVFWYLSGVGKEFITSHLELDTSPVVPALPVNCPDQIWGTAGCWIGSNHLLCTKQSEEHAGDVWKSADCGNMISCLSGKKWWGKSSTLVSWDVDGSRMRGLKGQPCFQLSQQPIPTALPCWNGFRVLET